MFERMTDSGTLIMNESVQKNAVIMEQWLKADQRSVPQTSSYSHIKEDCVSHESKTKHKKTSSVTSEHYFF